MIFLLRLFLPRFEFSFPFLFFFISQVVASQDWPEITNYAGLVCAQGHRVETIQDLFKTWNDPARGPQYGGMIR